MNILLIYPKMPDTFLTMNSLMKIIGKKTSYPPLGLLTVASILPEEWNKKLVDLNTTLLMPDDIKWADFIFISAMNVQTVSVYKTITECKKYDKTIVAGGPLFTHEHYKFNEIDHFVLDEAEITLPLFIDDLKNGTLKKYYTKDKFADITKSPTPLWSLIDAVKYAYSIIQYSRGCPYLCDFCDVTALFGRRPRTKTVEQVITELDRILLSSRPEIILFADDNLIGNSRELKNNLLPELIKWRRATKTAPGFATQVSINLADDPELMRLMIEAGFRHIFVGIETTDVKSLELCKKNQNLKRNILDDVNLLQQKGFIIMAGFIVGFDTDDENVFKEQLEFINLSGIVMVTVNILKAPPGTELHKRLSKENRLIELFDFDENKTNIITKMEKNILYEGYKKILDEICSPQNVYKRSKQFLSLYGNHKAENPIQKKIKITDVLIVLRAVYYAGLAGKGRYYFWKLTLETFLFNKKNTIHAFLFAVLMLQFDKMHKNYLKSYNEIFF